NWTAQAGCGVDFIKLWVDDRLGTELHFSPEIYRPLIERAHQHNIPVYAHMFYQQDAKDLADAGIDMLAHPVRDSLVDDGFVQIMKEHRVVQQTNFQVPWRYTMTENDGPMLWDDPLFLDVTPAPTVHQAREQRMKRPRIL